MAYRIFGDNPLSQPMMVCCQLHTKEYVSMKLYLKFKFFIQGNAFKGVVCKYDGHLVSASMCKGKYVFVYLSMLTPQCVMQTLI